MGTGILKRIRPAGMANVTFVLLHWERGISDGGPPTRDDFSWKGMVFGCILKRGNLLYRLWKLC
jgi:hypothetical protein